MTISKVTVLPHPIERQYPEIQEDYQKWDAILKDKGTYKDRRLLLCLRDSQLAMLYNKANALNITPYSTAIVLPSDLSLGDKHYSVFSRESAGCGENTPPSVDPGFAGILAGVLIGAPFGPVAAILTGFFSACITTGAINSALENRSIEQAQAASDKVLRNYFSDSGEAVPKRNVILQAAVADKKLFHNISALNRRHDDTDNGFIDPNRLARWLTFPFGEIGN